VRQYIDILVMAHRHPLLLSGPILIGTVLGALKRKQKCRHAAMLKTTKAASLGRAANLVTRRKTSRSTGKIVEGKPSPTVIFATVIIYPGCMHVRPRVELRFPQFSEIVCCFDKRIYQFSM
jgi:hypothetical protein